MVVLDTHVLIWWTLDPERLSATAKQYCDGFSKTGATISSISIWEIGIKVKRGHLELGLALGDYTERLKQLSWLEIAPVTAEHWIRARWTSKKGSDHFFPLSTCPHATPPG